MDRPVAYPASVADELPRHEGMIDLADELQAAGLAATGVYADSNQTWEPTPLGTWVAPQLAKSSEDDAAGMLSRLLETRHTEE